MSGLTNHSPPASISDAHDNALEVGRSEPDRTPFRRLKDAEGNLSVRESGPRKLQNKLEPLWGPPCIHPPTLLRGAMFTGV